MANNKSAQKRIHVAKRNRLQNRFYLTSVRTLTKKFQISMELKEKVNSQKLLNSIYSLIDKGTKRGVFHKNTAARRKSQLARSLLIV